MKRTLSENDFYNSPQKPEIKPKTPPDWVELREIIMKKEKFRILLNKVRRSLFNNYMIQYEA